MKRGRIITIGSFDGVHLGHAALLDCAVQEARKRQLKSLALTFSMPPKMVLEKTALSVLLTTSFEREWLIRKHGIDEVIFLDFNKQIAHVAPFQFFRDVLIERYQAKGIVVGADFRFGFNRSAGAVELVRWGLEYEIPVWVIPPVKKRGVIVSSSHVRMLLQNNQMRLLQGFLGHPVVVGGIVVKGRGLGKKIGFPTANIKQEPHKGLPRGVFAVRGWINKKAFTGVCNIGVRPTVSKNGSISVEVHSFGPVIPRPGQRVLIELLHALRPEKKFTSREELTRAIAKDVKRAKTMLHYSTNNKLYSRRRKSI